MAEPAARLHGMDEPGGDAPGRRTLRAFHQVLANTALANVTSSYLWWALTF